MPLDRSGRAESARAGRWLDRIDANEEACLWQIAQAALEQYRSAIDAFRTRGIIRTNDRLDLLGFRRGWAHDECGRELTAAVATYDAARQAALAREFNAPESLATAARKLTEARQCAVQRSRWQWEAGPGKG